jgi:IclR family acetate operon transcriptional repressor
MPDEPVKIESIEKITRILNALKELDRGGVTELSQYTGIPKSTMYYYLTTLERNEYVVKEDGKYVLGLQFLELGEKAREHQKLYEVAKPEADDLADKTGEIASVLVEEHGRGVFIHIATGEQAVHIDSYLGQRVPLHSLALGKAILAHLPRERVNEIIETHGLSEKTRLTITNKQELFDELEQIREDGIAFGPGERLQGLHGVAAPIKAPDGDVSGAISVAGPSKRITEERFRNELPDLVLSAANVIELNVTHN